MSIYLRRSVGETVKEKFGLDNGGDGDDLAISAIVSLDCILRMDVQTHEGAEIAPLVCAGS